MAGAGGWWFLIALRKKALAAATSRLALNLKSTVRPIVSDVLRPFRRKARSGWLLGCSEPRHQFIDALLRPAAHEACQEIGEIDLRIDAIELTGLDQRCQARPVLATFVRAGAIMPGF